MHGRGHLIGTVHPSRDLRFVVLDAFKHVLDALDA